MASFTIVVQHHPLDGDHSLRALRFADACVTAGHQIMQVFFYGPGVHHGNLAAELPSDELHPTQQWLELSENHRIPLVLCATVGSRHGVKEVTTDGEQAGFQASGLAEFTEALANAEQVVQF